MAREIRTKRTELQSEQRRRAVKFFRRLLLFFIGLCIICGTGLAYLWSWLERYEQNSVNGAIQAYFRKIDDEEWDELYYDDIEHFTELNSREAYTEYLKSVYSDRDTSEMKYSFTYTDGVSEYYDIHYDYYVMAALELRRDDTSSPYHVRTVGSSRPATFEVLDESCGFTINNVPITDAYAHEDGVIASAFEGYSLDYRIPEVRRYFISSLVGDPVLKGDRADVICVRDQRSDTYYIGKTAGSEAAEIFTANIYDTAVAYCKYITRDGSFGTLSQHLLQGTDFYRNIATFDTSWTSRHDSIEFDNVNIYDLIPVGENAFIGTITFDYIVKASDVQGTYTNSYQMFFIKNGQGYWKLVDMAIISDDVNVDIEQ